MNAIVYITTNKVNGKKYIGSHTGGNPNYLGSGRWLKPALKKYGKNNFIRQTLWEGPVEYMFEMEEYYIDYYNAYESPLFYNLSKKGVGWVAGRLKPELSEFLKGKPKSLEHRANMSKPKPKTSKALIGRTYSIETIAKMSEAKKGKLNSKSGETRRGVKRGPYNKNKTINP